MFNKKSKELLLVGSVNNEMLKLLVRSTEFKPKRIILHTEGGDIYTALSIYDWIRSELPETEIIAIGGVLSAGMIILQAGRVRYAYENCQFLIHYGEDSNSSLTTVKHNAKLQRLHSDILRSRNNISTKKMHSWFERETYLDANEALENGLIDYILGVE